MSKEMDETKQGDSVASEFVQLNVLIKGEETSESRRPYPGETTTEHQNNH